jgi:type II secretory pathway component HofQ
MKRILISVAIGVALLWAGYRVYRAHYNLVTLKVRDMDVRQAVSKIEWQTWERIIVNKDVSGKVTFDVHDVPLDAVLDIIALQTSGRGAHRS